MSTKLFCALLWTTVISGAALATTPYTHFDNGTPKRTNACTCCPAPIQPVASCLWELIQCCFGPAEQQPPTRAPAFQAPPVRSPAVQILLGDLQSERASIERQARDLRKDLSEPSKQIEDSYTALVATMDRIKEALEASPSPTTSVLSDLKKSTNELSSTFVKIRLAWQYEISAAKRF